jgi:hypothetical protein
LPANAAMVNASTACISREVSGRIFMVKSSGRGIPFMDGDGQSVLS